MAMPIDKPPTNMEELTRRCQNNTQFAGYSADTRSILPCPFCGAAGFMTIRLVAAEQDMADGGTCRECKRGAKMIIEKKGNGTVFEIVQDGGADPPEWLEPKIRRIS
jgi:hypothetical protein